jgi:hypothetical protein
MSYVRCQVNSVPPPQKHKNEMGPLDTKAGRPLRRPPLSRVIPAQAGIQGR